MSAVVILKFQAKKDFDFWLSIQHLTLAPVYRFSLHPGLAFNEPFAINLPQYEGKGSFNWKSLLAGQIAGEAHRHNYVTIISRLLVNIYRLNYAL